MPKEECRFNPNTGRWECRVVDEMPEPLPPGRDKPDPEDRDPYGWYRALNNIMTNTLAGMQRKTPQYRAPELEISYNPTPVRIQPQQIKRSAQAFNPYASTPKTHTGGNAMTRAEKHIRAKGLSIRLDDQKWETPAVHFENYAQPQPPMQTRYEVPMAPADEFMANNGVGFHNVSYPKSKAPGFTGSDPTFVQRNLGHAKQPVSYNEMYERQAKQHAENMPEFRGMQRKDPMQPLLEKRRDPFAPPGTPQYYYAPVEAEHEPIPVPDNFRSKAEDLVSLVKHLKVMENQNRWDRTTGLDSVDSALILMKRGAVLSKDNPDEFIRLLNEVFIGSNQNPPGIPKRILGEPRQNFGDLGMHTLYQDHSKMQMYHFWAYVNYGYYFPKDIAKSGNIFHEEVEPFIKKAWDKAGLPPRVSADWSKTGSLPDYRLSIVGYNIGQALSKGHISPSELSVILSDVLRTDTYDESKP